MKYRSDIDGLRALAIIPVVMYHNEVALFSGGFVGVDVFFVISGYLITLIIQEEIKQNRFSIAGFYERRVRRIFPALFAVIAFCSIYVYFNFLPWSLIDFGKSVVAATLFVANIYFWKEASYFGAAAETKPLLHTWSLSVEEQFYLIFPLILVWLYRRWQGRWESVLIPIALISLAMSIWGVHNFQSATFYLIPTRAWELLLGAFLAMGLFPLAGGQLMREGASAVGLAMILFAVFGFSQTTPFPGEYALIPCVGAALIIYAGRDGSSFVGRLLSIRPMVFVGLISYSLYLWHWPIIVFTKQLSYELSDVGTIASVLLASFVMGILSWRFVERPFRKKGAVFERRGILIAAAGIMTLSVAVGHSMHSTKGWPGRYGDELTQFEFDYSEYNLGTCFLDEAQDYTYWKKDACFLQRDKKHTTLLWGDSFAAHYVPGLKQHLSNIDSNILQYNAGGCAPVFDYDPKFRPMCKGFSEQIARIVKEQRIRTVVLSAGWAMALKNGLTYDGVRQTVEWLRGQAIDVYVIGQSPRFDHGVQETNYYLNLEGVAVYESKVSIDLNGINLKLLEIAGIDRFVDPSEFFCRNQMCRFKSEDGFYFWDDGHYTVYGSEQVVNYVFSRMKI